MQIKELKQYLRQINPDIKVCLGSDFHWSPRSQTITYYKTNQPLQTWSILHEAGHALLNHQSYSNDFDLLLKELEAWQEAKNIAHHFKLQIDQNHIENCLDTYRDWLDKRSQCPQCSLRSIQIANSSLYRCYNCQTSWSVTKSRHHRSYRVKKFD
jgi:hypothetical protein